MIAEDLNESVCQILTGERAAVLPRSVGSV